MLFAKVIMHAQRTSLWSTNIGAAEMLDCDGL